MNVLSHNFSALNALLDAEAWIRAIMLRTDGLHLVMAFASNELLKANCVANNVSRS